MYPTAALEREERRSKTNCDEAKPMKTLIAALMAVVLAAPMVTAEAALQSLFDREKTALSAVPKSRLKAMISQPSRAKAAKAEFSFSREWLDAQPAPEGGPQWACLSEALYFEARGETVKGQFAVAEVIMNRVESERFPDTPCDVINQGTGQRYQCQFTYTCDGREEVIAEKDAFEQVAKVARAILDGKAGDLTDGATHYHTTAVKPKWSRVYQKTARIGVHIFYRHTFRTASN